MRSKVWNQGRDFWAWPGPSNLYRIAILAVISIPYYYFPLSGFAASFVCAGVICGGLIYGLFSEEVTAQDWRNLKGISFWAFRAIAAAVGCWMFAEAPGRLLGSAAVLAFAAAYVATEKAMWRRKRTLEAATA